MKKLLASIFLGVSMMSFATDYTKYKSETLISPIAGKELIEKNKDLVIVDIRPVAKFLTGNIRGSYNMWRPDMEATDKRYGELGGMRASREELEKELNKRGVTNNSTILLIGDNLDEYRLWWIMDMYGAKNIKIVDGGYDALRSAGVSARIGAEPAAKIGNFRFPGTSDKDTLALFEEVKSSIGKNDTVILDTRSYKEFTGEEARNGAFGKGRVPGATFVEWNQALDKNKMMRPYDELVKMYTEAGVTPDKTIIPYCQSAVRSAHTAFVLQELLGYPKVKNFDGSWIEWSYEVSKNNAPVESGEKK